MGMQNETLANITEPSEFLYEAETAEKPFERHRC